MTDVLCVDCEFPVWECRCDMLVRNEHDEIMALKCRRCDQLMDWDATPDGCEDPDCPVTK